VAVQDDSGQASTVYVGVNRVVRVHCHLVIIADNKATVLRCHATCANDAPRDGAGVVRMMSTNSVQK